MWWVKDREILNHTVIFRDLSIPHVCLGAPGFRHMHARPAAAPFLLPASKNIFQRGCFFPQRSSPSVSVSLTFGRARSGCRSAERRRFLPLAFLCIVLPPCETLRRQPPHGTSCNSTHTAAARARPGPTPLPGICIMAADTYASLCIQLRLSLKTKKPQ